jgi:hypothetical protein
MRSWVTKSLRLLIIAALSLSLLGLSACCGSPLKFSPETLYDATLYQTYQASITVSGNKTPVGFIGIGSGALPDGLKLIYEQGKNTATISGDPTLLGTFSFTVNAWCGSSDHQSQNSSRRYEITVTRD